jgi:glucose-6-phosphate 1-dehydrogenase
MTNDHILVIFGASGDLTRRKLIPALAELKKLKLLPGHFAVLGIGRSPYEDESFREMIGKHLEGDRDILEHLHYQSMDPEKEEAYPGLKKRLEELGSQSSCGGELHFLPGHSTQVVRSHSTAVE